jgi:hypothetical protein
MSIAKFQVSMMSGSARWTSSYLAGVRTSRRAKLVIPVAGLVVGFVMKEMDSIYSPTPAAGPAESERALGCHEYAAEQVFIGASFHARFEAEDAVANGYEDRVIWGSDYPHFEGTYQYDAAGPNGEPMTWAALRFHYAGLPEACVRAFLSGNAMKAYDFDKSALTRVARRINAPTYADLNSAPVTEKPADGGHLAFRTYGFWA